MNHLCRLVVRSLRPRIRSRLLLAVPFALYGCTTPATTVATAQVARDFYRNRYDEACHVTQQEWISANGVPAWCAGFDVKLNAADKGLHEGTAALVYVHDAKAKMPLQLKAIADQGKALKEGYKP